MFQNNASSESNPILSAYMDWSNRTPYATRTTTVAMVVIYFFSCIINLESSLGNQTLYSVLSLEVYRLILSPLVGNSFLNTLVLLLFYPTMAARVETSIGSGQFMSLLLTLSLGTNILFSLVCLLLSLEHRYFLLLSCSGFWIIVFGLLVLECMQMPDVPRQLMCFPQQIPSRYFPLVFYGFICLFSGLQLDYLCAMAIGYMYHLGHLDKLKPSPSYIERMETDGSDGFLYSLSRQPGWIGCNATGLGFAHSSTPSSSSSWFGAGSDWSRDRNRESGNGEMIAMMNRGFFSGFSSSAEQSDGTQEGKQFPGSGRTLTAVSTQRTTLNQPSPPSSTPSSSSSSSSSMELPRPGSREEIAARRLAALGHTTNSSTSTSSNAPSSSRNNNNNNKPILPGSGSGSRVHTL